MAISASDNLVAWLRDAHAMEQQAITMLDAQHQRLENYPELKARIGQHLDETKQHALLIDECLDRLAGGSSTMKDMAGKVTAMAQGLGGIFASDEVVKGSMASYTFEHMEIASYRTLIAAAEYVGDTSTVAVCERILDEELAMAAWLDNNLAAIALQFLTFDESNAEAKR